jgi:hypothetical protein
MKALIEDYESFPGDHCGSVAMRGLLHHYSGLALPEAAVFGLGSGASAVYMSGPGFDPAAVLFGRTLSMEQDLATNLQIDYRERPETDDDEAWRIAREEILAGRPTMLSGDIFYLDYREYKVHFPSHRFVLLGFDDEAEQVFIADRIRPEPETCSLNALRLSRNPPEGLSTRNLWGRFHGNEVGRDLLDATRRSIAVCAGVMLGAESALISGATDRGTNGDEGAAGEPSLRPATGEGLKVVQGVDGIRAFAADLPGFAERDDATGIAGFNASCIEKFGNGGGNFRRLYSQFLTWAREMDKRLVPEEAPTLAWEAADEWTATSDALFAASREGADAILWNEAAVHAGRAAEIEERLFSLLANSSA